MLSSSRRFAPLATVTLPVLAITLLVSSCTSSSEQWNRQKLGIIGMKYGELVACAGPPDKSTPIDPHDGVISYGTIRSIPDGGYDECAAFIYVTDGLVRTVRERGNDYGECLTRFEACGR